MSIQIKLLCYNVLGDFEGPKLKQWDSRKQDIFDIVNEEAADITVFQEAHSGSTFYRTQNNDLRDWAKFNAYGEVRTSVMGLIRKDSKVSRDSNKINKSSDDVNDKYCLQWFQSDNDNSKKFVVINVHCHGKFSYIKELVKEVGMNVPIVIAGDFNCESPEKELPDGFTNARPQNWKEFKELSERPTCYPMHEFTASAKPCGNWDHIFVSHHWKTKEFRHIDKRRSQNNSLLPSDHRPIVATLVLGS